MHAVTMIAVRTSRPYGTARVAGWSARHHLIARRHAGWLTAWMDDTEGGDGVPDIVEQTTTTVYDLDGDGVPDIVETTTVTGIDANRDGKIDEDEISIDAAVAVRENLLDEGDAKS